MRVDFTVGEVGFGPAFGDRNDSEVEMLEAQLAEKQRHINALRRVLQKCAALSPEISDLKHEVLLETAPENH